MNQQAREQERNIRFIMKLNTENARAYLMSIFFLITLSLQGTFKFIQNSCRNQDNIIKVLDKFGNVSPDRNVAQAGAYFLADIWPYYREFLKKNT